MSSLSIQLGLQPASTAVETEQSTKRRKVGSKTLALLPASLIAYALSYLPLKDLQRKGVFTTCKSFNVPKDVYQFVVRTTQKADNCDIRYFQRFSCKQLKKFRTFTNILDRMAGLKHLILRSDSPDETVIDHVLASTTVSRLSKLSLTGGLFLNVTDGQLENLVNKCPELTELNLTNGTEITDLGITHLPKLKKLESLSLFSDNQLTEKSCITLGKIPSLRHVDVSNCQRVTSIGVQHLLETLPGLRSLGAGGYIGFYSGGELAVSRVVAEHGRNLESLSLEPCHYHATHLTQMVQNCGKLVEISISGYKQRESLQDLGLSPSELTLVLKRTNPKLQIKGLEKAVKPIVKKPGASTTQETDWCAVQ